MTVRQTQRHPLIRLPSGRSAVNKTGGRGISPDLAGVTTWRRSALTSARQIAVAARETLCGSRATGCKLMNPPMDDHAELLRDYVATRSERAFAELVRRHIDLVHSAALRRVGGDPHRAAEVTQMVFIDLARKAATLARHPLLIGWLHQSTRWAANNLRRGEHRRLAHERAAAAEWPADNEAPAIDWAALRPTLDDALDELKDAEREAVLLRFFHHQSFADVGRQLGTGESGARMRVERALDKLHGILRRKGLVGGVAALGAMLTQNAVAAAPAELAATVTPVAVAAGAAAAGATTGVAATILMSKLTMALIGAGVVTLAVLCLQQQQTLAAEREALANAREQHAARLRETARVAAQVERLQADLARLPSAAELPPPDPVEIERKRLDMVIRKGELDISYGPLFRRLRLVPVQLDAFKTLLVERSQATYDANQLAKQEGLVVTRRREQDELSEQATRLVDAEIVNLIGAEGFAEFRNYERPFATYGLLGARGVLVDEEAAWTKAKALADLWERTSGDRTIGGLESQLPAGFVEGARPILSPAEYRELLAEQESGRDLDRMAEIARAAAYAGKLKLSKGSQRIYAPRSADPKP